MKSVNGMKFEKRENPVKNPEILDSVDHKYNAAAIVRGIII